MIIQPTTDPELDLALGAELDDEFFSSDPGAYFRSRVVSLLKTASPTSTPSALETAVAFLLEPSCVSHVSDVKDREQELQVAIDAFALRHHVAEALVRLFHGIAVATGPSVWARISEGPFKTATVVEQSRTWLSSETGRTQFWSLVLPASVVNEPASEVPDRQLNVAADWLRHAMALLVRDEISLTTAHNRMKHGLAVRAQDDLLLTFTPHSPDPSGALPVSAVTGPDAYDLLAGPSLHYLVRPRKAKRVQGWELTTLELKPQLRLAETSMMIVALEAIFHLAGARHFADRTTRAELGPPAYPQLPCRPTPNELLGGTVIGLRQSVTSPPDGQPTDRPTGRLFHETWQDLHIDFADKITGYLVDG